MKGLPDERMLDSSAPWNPTRSSVLDSCEEDSNLRGFPRGDRTPPWTSWRSRFNILVELNRPPAGSATRRRNQQKLSTTTTKAVNHKHKPSTTNEASSSPGFLRRLHPAFLRRRSPAGLELVYRETPWRKCAWLVTWPSTREERSTTKNKKY